MAAEVHRQTKMKNLVLAGVWRSTALATEGCCARTFETFGSNRPRVTPAARSSGLLCLAPVVGTSPLAKWQG